MMLNLGEDAQQNLAAEALFLQARVEGLSNDINALTTALAAERALVSNVLAAWNKVQGSDYNGQEDWDMLVIALKQMSAAYQPHP